MCVGVSVRVFPWLSMRAWIVSERVCVRVCEGNPELNLLLAEPASLSSPNLLSGSIVN